MELLSSAIQATQAMLLAAVTLFGLALGVLDTLTAHCVAVTEIIMNTVKSVPALLSSMGEILHTGQVTLFGAIEEYRIGEGSIQIEQVICAVQSVSIPEAVEPFFLPAAS